MQTEGNTGLSSAKEEEAAEILKEKNLAYTNSISAMPVPKNSIYTRYVKRLLDIIISLPLFIITIPVNVILGIGTLVTAGRPLFYKQTRAGKDGKPFTLVKFRSMTDEKDENGNFLPPSERVTGFGKFMRKFSLDELLNFWSILKGDMSLIGPRPQPMFIYDRMSDRHKMRTAVRPGLECPRVIELDYDYSCVYQRTFENDIWYVENVSFKTDVKLVFHLTGMVFNFKKRNKQASGNEVSYFVGYDEKGHAISMRKYLENTQEVQEHV